MVGTAPTAGDCTAYWDFSSLNDLTSNGYNLTNSGATSGATGILGNCYSYDGVNDSMSFSTSAVVTGSNARSVSFWFKASSLGIRQPIFFFGQASANQVFGFEIQSDNDITTVGWSGNDRDTGANLTDTNWHHYVVTYGAGEQKVYVDGSLVDTWSHTYNTGSTFAYIGRHPTVSDTISGLLDEMCMFDVVLTADNATYLYQLGAPGTEQQYPFPVAPSSGDCTAYYKAEGDWTDAVGNYDGTNNGATSTTGILNNGMDFDGVNDEATTGESTAFNFAYNDSFSVSGWLNLDTTATTFQYLFSKQRSGSPFEGWSLAVIVGGKIRLYRWNSTSARYTLESTTALSTGTWYHIVAVWDADAALGYIYINGVAESTSIIHNTLGTADMTNALNVSIGVREYGSFGASEALNGRWDEGSIFNTALTANNAAYLYNAGSPGTAQQYPFTGGGASGWTGTFLGVLNPAKILGIAVANIAKVNGVE